MHTRTYKNFVFISQMGRHRHRHSKRDSKRDSDSSDDLSYFPRQVHEPSVKMGPIHAGNAFRPRRRRERSVKIAIVVVLVLLMMGFISGAVYVLYRYGYLGSKGSDSNPTPGVSRRLEGTESLIASSFMPREPIELPESWLKVDSEIANQSSSRRLQADDDTSDDDTSEDELSEDHIRMQLKYYLTLLQERQAA